MGWWGKLLSRPGSGEEVYVGQLRAQAAWTLLRSVGLWGLMMMVSDQDSEPTNYPPRTMHVRNATERRADASCIAMAFARLQSFIHSWHISSILYIYTCTATRY
jgi:hypothetical protein